MIKKRYSFKYYEYVLSSKHQPASPRRMVTILSCGGDSAVKRLTLLVSEMAGYRVYNQYKTTEVIKPEEVKLMSSALIGRGVFFNG